MAATAQGRGAIEPLDAYDRAIDAAVASIRLHGTAAVAIRQRTRDILSRLQVGGLAAVLAADGLSAPAAGLPHDDPGAAHPHTLYALYDALLRHAWELRQDDPRQMIEAATQATRTAAALGAAPYSAAQGADAQARAWAELANALRIDDQRTRAEDAMGAAFGHLARGTGDPLLTSHLLSLRASLFAAQGRYQPAMDALARAHAIHAQRGDLHNAGRALIQTAFYLGAGGQHEAALSALDQGLASIDVSQEPGLHAIALRNRIDLLVDLGQFAAAHAEMLRHRDELAEGQGLLNRLRITALEARLAAGLDDLVAAEGGFLAALDGFAAAGARHLAAMTALDLAAVHMRQERFSDAVPRIVEAIETLLTLDGGRELAQALLLLRTSCQMAAATVLQVQAVADLARRCGQGEASTRAEH